MERRSAAGAGYDSADGWRPGNRHLLSLGSRSAPAAIVSLDLARENKGTKSNGVVTFFTSETEQNRDEVTSELPLTVRTPV